MILGVCNYCKKEFRKRERKRKFCSLTCSNNFNRNGFRDIPLPPKSTKLAEFVGICLGDGCVTNYQTSITLNSNADKHYITYVKKLIKDLFIGAGISLVDKKNENATDIKINSKKVSDFVRNMGIISGNKKIPSWIFENFDYSKACVKGLFDTEGSISFKIYKSRIGISVYKQLNFRNTDIEFMKLVRDVLLNLKLKPTLSLKKSLYLSNNSEIDLYRKEIGFGNPKLHKRSLIYTYEDYSLLTLFS